MSAEENDNAWVVVGKIGATYGIRGWLKVFSFTEAIEGILDFQPWFVRAGSNWQPIEVKAGRKQGSHLVVHFAGMTTPEEARRLTGCEIAIKRSQLPSPDEEAFEYYWADLPGLEVFNLRGEKLGEVVSLIETGSNDVLILRDKNNKEHGIPWLAKTVIIRVDIAGKRIDVDWELL